MNFLLRSFLGLIILSITLGFLIFGSFVLIEALKKRSEKSDNRRFQKERVFAVNVETLNKQIASPKILSYGEIYSKRMLEIRPLVSGRLDYVSEKFVEGGYVKSGDILFRLNQKDYLNELEIAEIDLEDTKAQLSEAISKLDYANLEFEVSESQLNLRKNALDRQTQLAESGLITSSQLENTQLAYSSSKQQFLNKQNLVKSSKNAIDKLKIQLKRRSISIDKAKRNLDETEIKAPFDGIIASVNILPGSVINKNEKLGTLLDPNSLEVMFNLSANEFARVIDKDGKLLNLDITAYLKLSNNDIPFSGKIERINPEIMNIGSGRKLFASINLGENKTLRPGDFVVLEIKEPSLKNITVLPSSAVTIDGKIFILEEDNRLKEIEVTILRRQGNEVIVSGAPTDKEYVMQRSPQLGNGLKIKPLRKKDREISNSVNLSKNNELVTISPEKQKKLINILDKLDRMPKSVKDRLYEEINSGKIKAKTLKRLEKNLGNN
jgi:RND family efflux transporter MFP subunit